MQSNNGSLVIAWYHTIILYFKQKLLKKSSVLSSSTPHWIAPPLLWLQKLSWLQCWNQ